MFEDYKFNKILITGNAGAGKSTFANALAKKLQRQAIYFDSLIWKSNWELASSLERKHIAEQILA